MKIGDIPKEEKEEEPQPENVKDSDFALNKRPTIGQIEWRLKGIVLIQEGLLILGCVSNPEIDLWKSQARWWLEQ